MLKRTLLSISSLGLAACAVTPEETVETVTTPEGAVMEQVENLAYAPGELTEEQLTETNRALFVQDSMNVFRRFPREKTEEMVRFYTGALALRSLSPIQLTSTQQMILTGVGSGQIKLSAGQGGTRLYNLEGGVKGGTGIRFFTLTYPDQDVVKQRFADAGFSAPAFAAQDGGAAAAMVTDPGGFPIQIMIKPGAKDHSDDGVGVNIAVSDIEASLDFYHDFVGLDAHTAVEDPLLGATKYPFRHGETTIYLYEAGKGLPADTGSAGIQYVVSDAALVAARGAYRDITVENPLNKLGGFDLVTVWLNDPDGVTNYFAQVGPNSRTARETASD